MFVVQRYYGTKSDTVRERFVALPLITALTVPEPGEPQRYFVLPPEQPPPPPRGTGRGMGHHGARPRARNRDLVPLA